MLLIGIERGVTKEGKAFNVMHMIGENIDNKRGKGQKVMTEFAFLEVPDSMIGKNIELTYSKSYNGRAYLNNIKIID